MPEPKPLTRGQKIAYIVFLILGVVLLTIGIILSVNNSLSVTASGTVLGAGGASLAIGFIGLFHRPDR